MNNNEIRQILLAWIKSEKQVQTVLARSGFMQEGSDRLFPDMGKDFRNRDNIARLLEAFSQLGSILREFQVEAIPMLVFNLDQLVAVDPRREEISLSREIDSFHPPLFYVLEDRCLSLLPVEAEYRFPMELKLPAGLVKGEGATCVLVATLAEPDAGGVTDREWDRDVRLIGAAAGVVSRYVRRYAGTVGV
jgi:hypothetical protein